MKLPKKFQGTFKWDIATQAIDMGYTLDVEDKSYKGGWYKIPGVVVCKDCTYRVSQREFSDGWYRMIGADNLPISQIVYHECGLWYRVGVVGSVDINPNDVGDRIL